MKDPQISIIIPVYNVAPYIENCLNSVLEQEYDNLEIIIVDDCGNDNSMGIVECFCSVHSGNFILLKHNRNRGLSAARNTGIKQATGDYLFFLDSDDELPKGAIKIFVQYINQYGNADFLIGNFLVEGDFHYKPLPPPVVLEGKEITYAYLRDEWYVMACGKLINRDFFIEQNLWFAVGRLHEDELFSFHLALAANRMITVQEPVYKYIIRENSITTLKKEKNYIDLFWIVLKKIELVKLDYSRFSFSISQYCISLLFQYAIFVSESYLPYRKKKILLKWTKEKALSLRTEKLHLKSLIQLFILSSPTFIDLNICKIVRLFLLIYK